MQFFSNHASFSTFPHRQSFAAKSLGWPQYIPDQIPPHGDAQILRCCRSHESKISWHFALIKNHFLSSPPPIFCRQNYRMASTHLRINFFLIIHNEDTQILSCCRCHESQIPCNFAQIKNHFISSLTTNLLQPSLRVASTHPRMNPLEIM